MGKSVKDQWWNNQRDIFAKYSTIYYLLAGVQKTTKKNQKKCEKF